MIGFMHSIFAMYTKISIQCMYAMTIILYSIVYVIHFHFPTNTFYQFFFNLFCSFWVFCEFRCWWAMGPEDRCSQVLRSTFCSILEHKNFLSWIDSNCHFIVWVSHNPFRLQLVFCIIWVSHFTILIYFDWLRITNGGSLPEMCIWLQF